MNGRERIIEALNHRESDRIPFDLAGTTWTGITNGAYRKLRDNRGFSSPLIFQKRVKLLSGQKEKKVEKDSSLK